MRIISGKARGISIQIPKNDVRPTTQIAKEALFSVLGSKAINARVLDLFAGSGGLGLEALSRGAYSCVFVDNSYSSCSIIKKNILHSKLENTEIICKKVNLVLKSLSRQFDLIFADPPYFSFQEKHFWHSSFFSFSSFLFQQGFFILEKSKEDEVSDIPNLSIRKIKKFGGSHFVFYQKDE